MTQGSEHAILNETNPVVLALWNALRMPRGCVLEFYSVLCTKISLLVSTPHLSQPKEVSSNLKKVSGQSGEVGNRGLSPSVRDRACHCHLLGDPVCLWSLLFPAYPLLAFRESKGLRKQFQILVRCYLQVTGLGTRGGRDHHSWQRDGPSAPLSALKIKGV